MRDDLKRAVDLVRQGRSYRQAAEAVGVTRNAVAGACSRAGVKMDPAAKTVRLVEGGVAGAAALVHKLRTDPEFAKANAEHSRQRMIALFADPAFARAHAERMRDRYADPEFAKAHAERSRQRLRALHADPAFAKAHAERARQWMTALNRKKRERRVAAIIARMARAGGSHGAA